MDKGNAIILAQQYIDTVGKKYDISKALIFGSYVKGTHHADSDVDVALVLKDVENLFDAQVDLMTLRQDKDLAIEPHPFREADFNSDDPFVYEIMHNGMELAV